MGFTKNQVDVIDQSFSTSEQDMEDLIVQHSVMIDGVHYDEF